MNLDDLLARQRFSLWLEGRPGLHSADEAAAFLRDVGLALRYGASESLRLASLYRATQRQIPPFEDEKTAHPRAFELTNALLASGEAIEINVIASRLTLASPAVMPAIYALRRIKAEPRLSEAAQEAFDFITANETATSGDVRRLLNVTGQARPDPADLALTELQRGLLVDRGPSSTPDRGIFYLPKEGYPYRVLAQAHPEVPRAAARLRREDASLELVTAYLRAALFAAPQRLHSMLQLLLTREELDTALQSLIASRAAERQRLGRAEVVVYQAGALHWRPDAR